DDLAATKGVVDVVIGIAKEREHVGALFVEVHVSTDNRCVDYYLRKQVLSELRLKKVQLSAERCNFNTQIIYNAICKYVQVSTDQDSQAPIAVENVRTLEGRSLHC